MRIFLLLNISLFTILSLAPAAYAADESGEAPKIGMKHLRVAEEPAVKPDAPTATAPQPVAAAPTAPQPAKPAVADEATTQRDLKPLTPDKAFVKQEDLKAWEHMHEVIALVNDESINKVLSLIESDPGNVPPQAMLFLTKALVDQKRMEEAALYFYIAQLRVSFDAARWPPRIAAEDLEKIKVEQTKSADQQGQVIGAKNPSAYNPHSAIIALSSLSATPVSQWMFEDPARAKQVLDKVKKWDASTPYAYLPGYDLPQAQAFESWPKLLESTRTSYFARMGEFIDGLSKLKTPRQ